MAIVYEGELEAAATTGGTGASTTITLDASAAAGSTVILIFAARLVDTSGLTVVDSRNNHWTVDVAPQNAGNNMVFIASTRQNTATLQAADTITVAFTNTLSAVRAWYVEEFSGLWLSAALDETATNGNGANTTGPGSTGTTAATDTDDELVISAIHLAANEAIGKDADDTDFTSLTLQMGGDFNKALRGAYRIVAATGTQDSTFTWTTSASYQAMTATYRGGTAPDGQSLWPTLTIR